MTHFAHKFAGKAYQVEITPKRVLNMGTQCDILVRDEVGRIVAQRIDAYVQKGETMQFIDSLLQDRPTLTALRTQETAHSPALDMGPKKSSLWDL